MIIDSETHVVYRWWPIELNPHLSRAFRPTWSEHSGDLLVDEMDRAGVDQSFLISYDAEDMAGALARSGSSAEDLITGRNYTRSFVQRYPTRFFWFVTLKDPRRPESIRLLETDFDDAAVGVKIFPAQLGLRVDGPELELVFRLCLQRNRRVILSFEETTDRTPSVADYLHQLDTVLGRLPELQVQLNHGGCIDPLSPAADVVFRVVDAHENVLLSTSYLGLVWEDGWEYPFPRYLTRLERLYEAVGAERLMWATDWPWPESWLKYPQALDAVRRHASFFSERDKQRFLGENAAAFVADFAPPAIERRGAVMPAT